MTGTAAYGDNVHLSWPSASTGSPVPDRLPVLRPTELTADQTALYDEIAHGARATGPRTFDLVDADGGLTGPFNAMLYAPALGQTLQALGTAVRYATALSARARELAVLEVAAAWDSEFERYAHEAVGRAVGLTEPELDAARAAADVPLTDAYERAVVTTTRTLARSGDLDDATYASAFDILGPVALVELTTLVGYYATLALQLRVFRVAAPRGAA